MGQQMDILLKEPDAKAHVEVMKTNVRKLSMTGTNTQVSGQSEALEKFLSVYQDFLETLSTYQTVITSDLQNVSNAVFTLTEADKAQGEQIENLGAFSSLIQP